jgi:anti-anti-sigma factor
MTLDEAKSLVAQIGQEPRQYETPEEAQAMAIVRGSLSAQERNRAAILGPEQGLGSARTYLIRLVREGCDLHEAIAHDWDRYLHAHTMETGSSLTDVSHVGDVTVVAIRSSSIDAEHVPELRQFLEALVARGCLKLVLDLSQLKWISSGTLGMFVRLLKDTTQSLGPHQACRRPPGPGEVMWHVGRGGCILFPDRESAIDAAALGGLAQGWLIIIAVQPFLKECFERLRRMKGGEK